MPEDEETHLLKVGGTFWRAMSQVTNSKESLCLLNMDKRILSFFPQLLRNSRLHWVLAAACGVYFLHQGWNPGPPALGTQILNPWTTREVPRAVFLVILSGTHEGRERHHIYIHTHLTSSDFSVFSYQGKTLHSFCPHYSFVPQLQWGKSKFCVASWLCVSKCHDFNDIKTVCVVSRSNSYCNRFLPLR